MDRVAASPGGEAGDIARFRRLTSATIGATFALILIGGAVRVSDSGLGCGAAGSGTEGWPLCEGRVLPFLEANALVEFSHRLAATVVSVLILALAITAWRRLRQRRWLVRGSFAAGVLVLAQAGLGGLTVEHGLHEYLVAAHLGLAMLLLALLIALRRGAQIERPRQEAPTGLRVATAATTGLVLAAIVAGGLVAGTEGEGRANEPVAGAHSACGQQFPGCVDRFMPFGEGRLIDIQLAHRLLVYLTVIAAVTMVALAVRAGVRPRAFLVTLGLVAGQVGLGAVNVLAGEQAGLVLGHLALGTLLWAAVVEAGCSLLSAAAPAADPLRPRPAAGGAAA